MKIKITENQYNLISTVLSEAFGKGDSFATFIRGELKKIYSPLGKWGKAPNPDDNCITEEGVIGIFPHSEEDTWSILNRFDTNTKVKKEIESIFESSDYEDKTESGFRTWISLNSNELFGPDGEYTQRLVDLNTETVIKGNRNELYAVSIIGNRFPDAKIKRYCSGDIRDTRKGMDISVEIGDVNLNYQVKPFSSVISFIDDEGDTFFEVKSYVDVTKYSEKNVNVFMFVDSTNNQFISFANVKRKIGKVGANIIRFYEAPLETNMTFKTRKKKSGSNVASKLYGLDDKKLENIDFRLNSLANLKKKYLKKKP
jgi:hypothetical protein